MQLLVRHRILVILTILIFDFSIGYASATTNAAGLTSSLTMIASLALSRTCESRTINYITHVSVLPSICLKYSRPLPSLPTSGVTAGFISQTTSEPTNSAGGSQSVTSITVPANSASPNTVLDASAPQEEESENEEVLNESAFLSFEDWKKQRLEKEGLSDPTPEEQRVQTIKIPGTISDTLEAFGDDDAEIEADLGVFLNNRLGAVASGPEDGSLLGKKLVQNAADGDTKSGKPKRRSKDAGKTCKERFNFASIDAGGQVMKTNPEAKSASALLSENRDVYMLNICQAKNKFLIIELSELILVETIAIANFEFFSSTFRRFQVSVSDRYPVKLDQWVELGIFEAENSRDVQAFLVEDSRIWARYLRVEFMSHFGNEFYCPVSLLRVHGRTMIQEIQDTLKMEQLVDGADDAEDDPRAADGEVLVPEAEANNLHPKGLQEASEKFERIAVEITSQPLGQAPSLDEVLKVEQSSRNTSMAHITTPWIRADLTVPAIFDKSSTHMCLLSASPTTLPTTHAKLDNSTLSDHVAYKAHSGTSSDYSSLLAPTATGLLALTADHNSEEESLILSDMQNASSTSSSFRTTTAASLQTGLNFAESITITGTVKSSAVSAAHISQPTTQESFFKSVSKRLQQLEANSTLSLTYIEEQSRILRDAFMKVEKRQLLKTTSFLENLNDTVLDELRKFSKQYDQIWQSTVIELETQRDQSLREIAAVSTRLNILADELVFQKRMSIIQSVLLLLCLGLVIFSRGFTGIDMPIIQNMVARSRSVSRVPFDGLTHSSVIQRDGSLPDGRPWVGARHGRHTESTLSVRSASQDASSPRICPEYSRKEDYLSCGGSGDYLLRGTQESPMTSCDRSDHDESCNNDDLSLRADENDSRTHHTGLQHGRRAYLEHCSFGPRTTRNSDESIGKQRMGIAIDNPSPSPGKENLERNISRKPLPALPKDNEL
jgi:Sad1 / UNC-like C-terminal